MSDLLKHHIISKLCYNYLHYLIELGYIFGTCSNSMMQNDIHVHYLKTDRCKERSRHYVPEFEAVLMSIEIRGVAMFYSHL